MSIILIFMVSIKKYPSYVVNVKAIKPWVLVSVVSIS